MRLASILNSGDQIILYFGLIYKYIWRRVWSQKKRKKSRNSQKYQRSSSPLFRYNSLRRRSRRRLKSTLSSRKAAWRLKKAGSLKIWMRRSNKKQ